MRDYGIEPNGFRSRGGFATERHKPGIDEERRPGPLRRSAATSHPATGRDNLILFSLLLFAPNPTRFLRLSSAVPFIAGQACSRFLASGVPNRNSDSMA